MNSIWNETAWEVDARDDKKAREQMLKQTYKTYKRYKWQSLNLMQNIVKNKKIKINAMQLNLLKKRNNNSDLVSHKVYVELER